MSVTVPQQIRCADAPDEPATFSILFPGRTPALRSEEPGYFHDLNLDQAVQAIVAGRDDYELLPFFHTRLTDIASITYRHSVFTDLDEVGGLRRAIGEFAKAMRQTATATGYAATVHNEHERRGWHLHAAQRYVAAARALAEFLTHAPLRSPALRGFRDRLRELLERAEFTELADHADRVAQQLYQVTYCLDIQGARVRVSRYDGERNYEAVVREVFAKFEQTGTERPDHDFHSRVDLNHVEARILNLVATLFPEQFDALAQFREHHRHFLDDLVAGFDREIQFYCAVAEFRDRLSTAGLEWCLPEVRTEGKALRAIGLFDIALADKLSADRGKAVVRNDIELGDEERVIVVTGPNQGGKTTFARAFGQLHHLAALGIPVPGSCVRIRLCDKLFAHFEREEDLGTLSGKLEDELHRVHEVLSRATGESVVVMNESFTSTTVHDAATLGTAILQRMLDLDPRCLYVTFVEELSRLSPATVSMVAEVDPDDPAARTFRVTRRPADGMAYAAALARLHGLTADRVKERMHR